jgi:xylan 1,4-beta-xylosidase
MILKRLNQRMIVTLLMRNVLLVFAVSCLIASPRITAGPASSLALVSGNNQITSSLNALLPNSLTVVVTDAGGNPVSGTTVTFTVTSVPPGATGQMVLSPSVVTGANGLAATELQLGNTLGAYVITASVGGLLVSPVFFTESVVAGVPVSFNVNKVVGTANPAQYSMNLQYGMDPAIATNREYRQNLADIAPGMVRYHSGYQETSGSGQCWVNYSTFGWDSNKINTVLGSLGYNPANRLICINSWPTWMDNHPNNGFLNTNFYNSFASMCSNLVGIVNQQLGYQVKYWEILNEMDGTYATNIGALGSIVAKCATAMKAQDPTIKIAGAAWTTPYSSVIPGFLSAAGSSLDGWTHHEYGGGAANQSPLQIYAWGSNVAGGASYMAGTLANNGFANLPMWITEYNVFYSYNYDLPTYYMKSAVGMVFDALTIKSVVEGGNASGLFIWNDADNTYGSIQYDSTTGTYSDIAPSGYLLMDYNKWGVGNVLQTISGNSSLVSGYAVEDSAGHIMLSLINQSATNEEVVIGPMDYLPSTSTVEEDVIGSTGITRSLVDWSNLVSTSGISIASNNVIILRINQLTETPYGGTPAQLPTTIQADNFDNGGEGIAYHSGTQFNSGWVYRTDVGINIFPILPMTNTFSIALATGDWVQYTVDIPAGTYTINAVAAGSGAFTVALNGTPLGAFSPSTAGTNAFATFTLPAVNLAGGTSQVLRITSTAGGFNLKSLQFIVVPTFIGLNSATNIYGATNLLLTGQIGDVGSAYPALGDPVSATINAVTVSGSVVDSTGDFLINFNDPSLATFGVSGSPYPITYQYAGNANAGLEATTNGGTTLIIAPASPSLSIMATPINAGQSLASSSLNGSTATNLANNLPVPGGFTFADSTIAPSAGTTNVLVIFTPQDLVDFNLVTNSVSLTVTTPSPITISSGTISPKLGLLLNFNGPAGQSYEVLSSTNLLLPLGSWTIETTGSFGAGATTFTNPAPTDAQHFYRIKSP